MVLDVARSVPGRSAATGQGLGSEVPHASAQQLPGSNTDAVTRMADVARPARWLAGVRLSARGFIRAFGDARFLVCGQFGVAWCQAGGTRVMRWHLRGGHHWGSARNSTTRTILGAFTDSVTFWNGVERIRSRAVRGLEGMGRSFRVGVLGALSVVVLGGLVPIAPSASAQESLPPRIAAPPSPTCPTLAAPPAVQATARQAPEPRPFTTSAAASPAYSAPDTGRRMIPGTNTRSR